MEICFGILVKIMHVDNYSIIIDNYVDNVVKLFWLDTVQIIQ